MRENTISLRLRATVASIFVVLFLVFIFVVSYLNKVSENQGSYYLQLGALSQLEDASNNLKQKGQYYVQNAPRDYESYFRDVAVFHREMQNDVALLEKKLARVVDAYPASDQGFYFAIQRRLYGENWHELTAQIAESESHWALFKQGLNEAVGSNPEEPRLEWAAKYIVNNADELSAKITQMIESYRALVADTDRNRHQLSVVTILMAGTIMLLGLVLMQWIMWRVGKTAAACERVAKGEFGYQIPDKANDEIGQLTRAFNSLSGRIRLVLGLLTKLNSVREPGDALAAFWQDSKSYLDADWIGLMIQTTEADQLVLTHQQSRSAVKGWQNRKIDLFAGSAIESKVARSIENRSALLWGDVTKDTAEISGSLFFREMIQKTMPSSFVVLPLVNHDASWKAVMVIAKGLHKEFSAEQIDLLDNLAPVIGSIFANATSNKTVSFKKRKKP